MVSAVLSQETPAIIFLALVKLFTAKLDHFQLLRFREIHEFAVGTEDDDAVKISFSPFFKVMLHFDIIYDAAFVEGRDYWRINSVEGHVS